MAERLVSSIYRKSTPTFPFFLPSIYRVCPCLDTYLYVYLYVSYLYVGIYMYIESIFSREYSLRRESILRNLKLYSSSPFSPYKFPCLVESDDRTTILCNLVYGISNKFVRHTRLLGRGAENVVVARSHPRRATFYSKPHDARRMEIT